MNRIELDKNIDNVNSKYINSMESKFIKLFNKIKSIYPVVETITVSKLGELDTIVFGVSAFVDMKSRLEIGVLVTTFNSENGTNYYTDLRRIDNCAK